jgi:hypothetical protein
MFAPVHKSRLIGALMGASACALMAACSPVEPTQPPPPPPTVDAPPPPLAGGAPPPVSYSPYGPPPPGDAQIVTMNPIANPEDMSPEERAQVYGHGGHAYAEPPYRPHYPRDYVVRTVRGHRVVTLVHGHWSRPLAHDHVSARPAGHPIEARHPASTGPASQAASPAVATARQPAPAVAKASSPPVTSRSDAKLQRLQASVSQAGAQGAQLSVSPAVLQGQPGPVTLTLPANLDDILRAEAAKANLRRAARQAEASVTLTGDGFTVMPAGAQTQALKPGKALQFSWQVTPGPSASGTLHAQIGAALKGQGAPRPLSLGAVQSPAVQAAPPSQPEAASGLHLPSFSHFLAKLEGKDQADSAPALDKGLPGTSHLSGRAQIAILLALLAVLILLLIQKNIADQQKAAKRRRARAARQAEGAPPNGA